MLGAESSAAFDGFTRNGLDDQMKRQGTAEWPNYFRTSRLIPAVEYVNANRQRYLLMEKINEALKDFDVVYRKAIRGGCDTGTCCLFSACYAME